MKKPIGRAIFSLVIGIFAGVLGSVVHFGPVDSPVVGLILASIIVGSGAWLIAEIGRLESRVAYFLGVLGVILWLSFAPPKDDVLQVSQSVFTTIWIYSAPVITLIPVLLLLVKGKKKPHENN